MDYKRFSENGIAVEIDGDVAAIAEAFGFLGGSTFPEAGLNGLCVLSDESGFYYGENLKATRFEETEKGVEIDLETPCTRYTVAFEYQGDGVWKRCDRIKNLKNTESKITSCLSRFVFSGGNFNIVTQEGGWCGENETSEKPVSGNVTLSNNGIRTTQDAQPFICLKEKNRGFGLTFHLFPVGQWKINALKRFSGQKEILLLDMGLFDEGLRLILAPEEEIKLPEIVFFRSEPDDFGYGQEKIQRYVLNKKSDAKRMPLLYNTWFYDFENLDAKKLEKQLDAAEKLGLEYFVIDSGWFGDKTDGWYNQCGNWFENEKTNFRGKMKDFADLVRSRGLKFGLWFEPERVTKSSRFYKESPELFIDLDGSNALYDFSKPEACDKLFNIIKENVEKYGVEFIKFDYNAALAVDPTGSSFYRYYTGWYSLMDRFRRELPRVFFECCSSGGLRDDLSTLLHYDSAFTSDLQDPFRNARIADGAFLRFPPRFMTKWLALCETSGVARRYYKNEETDSRLLSATDGAWETTVELPIEYLEAFSLPSGLGFTADVASFSEKTLSRLKEMIAFWKEARPFVEKATLSSLTPKRPHSNRTDDVVWQLSNENRSEFMIAAIHMENSAHGMKVIPRHIAPEKTYRVEYVGAFRTNGFDGGYTVKGRELYENGLLFAFPDVFTGRIAKITELN